MCKDTDMQGVLGTLISDRDRPESWAVDILSPPLFGNTLTPGSGSCRACPQPRSAVWTRKEAEGQIGAP